MNVDTDPVLARIGQAERMLQTARDQHRKGYAEEAAEFLASAGRHIGKAQEALRSKKSETGISEEAAKTRDLSPRKGLGAWSHNLEVAGAR